MLDFRTSNTLAVRQINLNHCYLFVQKDEIEQRPSWFTHLCNTTFNKFLSSFGSHLMRMHCGSRAFFVHSGGFGFFFLACSLSVFFCVAKSLEFTLSWVIECVRNNISRMTYSNIHAMQWLFRRCVRVLLCGCGVWFPYLSACYDFQTLKSWII